MPTRTALSEPEQDLVVALRSLSIATSHSPRPSFANELRSQIVSNALAIEAEEAEKFQLALDGAAIDGDLAELATFATSLSQDLPGAPASIRFGLRNQLVSSAQKKGTSIAAARSFVQRKMARRLVMGFAASSMLVSSSAMAMSAAANDTPADALFGLKRFGETAQTWLMSGPDEGVRRLSFADKRLGESETMIDRGVTDGAPYETALVLFKDDVALATDLIIEGESSNPSAQEALSHLASFVTDQHERLVNMAPNLPEPARGAADEAVSLIETVAIRTEGATGECVLCAPDPSVLPGELPGDACAGCAPTPGTTPPTANPTKPGFVPNPTPSNPGGTDPKGDGETKPPPAKPTPPEVPQPLPDSDPLPDLPGGLDDPLQGPVTGITSTIKKLY